MIPTSTQVVNWLVGKYGDGKWYDLECRSANLYREAAARFDTTAEEMELRGANGIQRKFQHTVRNGINRLQARGRFVSEGNLCRERSRFRIVSESEAAMLNQVLDSSSRYLEALKAQVYRNIGYVKKGGSHDLLVDTFRSRS